MRLLLLCLFVWTVTATASLATCSGRDLRDTLSPSEQREVQSRLAATPFAEGNHWIARKAGQTLHIVGTVHIHDPRLTPIHAALAPILDQAQLLLVEGTEADQAKLQQAIATQPDLLFLTQGPTLPERLSEPDWQRLAQAARARGIPPFLAAKMQPWYLSLMLSMPACALDQAKSKQLGLDNLLMQEARAKGVPQAALEPYDTLFTLMAQDPIERQIDFIRLGLLPERAAREAMVTLLASYFENRPAEVMEVSRITTRRYIDLPPAELDQLTDEMLDKILTQRNIAWLPRILAAPDGVTVVAVGAAHLPGTQGLLNLLAQTGYRLEPQPFPCPEPTKCAGASGP